jgi:hypothetical protein
MLSKKFLAIVIVLLSLNGFLNAAQNAPSETSSDDEDNLISMTDDEASNEGLKVLVEQITPKAIVNRISGLLNGNNGDFQKATMLANSLALNLLKVNKTFLDIKDESEFQVNPLHCTTSWGYMTTLKILLNTCSDKKKAIFAQDKCTRNLFFHAALANRSDILAYLFYNCGLTADEIKNGLLIKGAKKNGTSVHGSAFLGCIASIREILKWGSQNGCAWELITAKDRIGNTPLHEAALHNHIGVVSLLLETA